MFHLTPLAIALQGIGYGTLLESLQGLVAVTVVPPPFEEVSSGAAAVIPVRHRIRRRLIPSEWPTWSEDEDVEDEELLLEVGAL